MELIFLSIQHTIFNENIFGSGIFIDLKKTFDSLDRDIVLAEFNDVKYDVPQGYILSPLLILSYMNDIIYCCSDYECVRFAEDTSLYLSSSNIENLFVSSTFALNKYKEWFDASKLILSDIKKTRYMIFHREQHTIPHTSLSIMIDRKVIEKVNKTKFLGEP